MATMDGKWIKGTGGYITDELSAQDSVLKHLDVGTKVMRCTSAGTVAFPSTVAYGEWEWDWLSTGTNVLSVSFLSDSIIPRYDFSGYIILESSGIMYFRRVDGDGITSNTLLSTDSGYLLKDTWYRIKITRTKDGEFTVYIRGGDFGNTDWTLVSVTGGTGTNPVVDSTYSESQYFVLDLDVGDKIANIEIRNQVTQ
jgi:hypothetical protein